MRDYFEAEMRLLYESAQVFADKYPEQAGMLNLSEVKDRDPYIERLLEGMAYLTAQIRQHIDDDIPEISETFLNQLWPRFMRAYPSSSIVQFSHRLGQLQTSQTISSGKYLLSSPVGDENVVCRFRTISDVHLHPLRIQRVNVEEAPGSGAILRFRMQFDSGIHAADISLSDLKLYLHSDPAVSLWLHHQLTAGLVRLKISFPEYPSLRSHVFEGQESIVSSYCTDELLCDNDHEEAEFPGFKLLHDYFCFREKYYFITIKKLNEICWPDKCNNFDMEIFVRTPPPQDHNIGRDTFKLHCSPCVNLFSQESEPIYLDHRRVSYPVIAEHAVRDGVHVNRVDSVTGLDVATGVRNTYYPLEGFRDRDKDGRFFHTSRKNLGGEHPEMFISVVSNDLPVKETLSCEITASNGDYPRRYLREHSISTPPSGFPSYASFRNITRPSQVYEPPDRQRYRWELISHMSLNFNSLARPGVLQRILRMYEWTGDEQNQRRIDAISDAVLESVERIQRGALMRGVRIKLNVEEKGFRSISDIYLMGCVLHRFFAMYASINCFVETVIHCHPSHEELTWKPLPGENSPI